MSEIQSPSNKNIVLSAYETIIKKQQIEPANLAVEYEQYFVTSVNSVQGESSNFERFSIVYPPLPNPIARREREWWDQLRGTS